MCQLIVKGRQENGYLPSNQVFVSSLCLTGVLRSVAQLWPPWAHFSDRHLSLCGEPHALIDYWPPQQSHRCTQLPSSYSHQWIQSSSTTSMWAEWMKTWYFKVQTGGFVLINQHAFRPLSERRGVMWCGRNRGECQRDTAVLVNWGKGGPSSIFCVLFFGTFWSL